MSTYHYSAYVIVGADSDEEAAAIVENGGGEYIVLDGERVDESADDECTCPDGGWRRGCPTHGTSRP